jgi:hypothetical protein
VLRDGAGVSALARFDRDVAVQTGVKYVFFMEGINDVGLARQDPQPTPEELVAGYKQLIERAHTRGLKIFGATLTPFEGVTIANYFTEQGETTRQAVNQWIRTSKAYDAVIDFERSCGSGNPPEDACGIRFRDHLHPNDASKRRRCRRPVAIFKAGRWRPARDPLVARCRPDRRRQTAGIDDLRFSRRLIMLLGLVWTFLVLEVDTCAK